MSNDKVCGILKSARKIELGKKAVEDPGPGDVLISMRRVGICGTDIGVWSSGGELLGNTLENVILGHECAGVITKVGSDVKHLKEGDKVTLNPAISCGHCTLCRADAATLCETTKFLGLASNYYGGLMEAIVHPARFVYKVPDNMTMDEAVCIEPISVAYRGCVKAGISKHSKVLISGCGPIGLCCLLMAKALGAATVAITGTHENRLTIAKSVGATLTFKVTRDSDTLTTSTHIIKEMGGPPDCVLETIGYSSAINLAIATVKKTGTIVELGIPKKTESINIEQITFKEIQMKGSLCYSDRFNEMIEMVASHRLDVTPLITHHFPLYKAQEAFEAAARREGMKILIHCDEVAPTLIERE